MKMELSFVCAVAIRRIPRTQIEIARELGEGAFGRVYLGTCDLLALIDDTEPTLTSESSLTVISVALKTLKESSQGRGTVGVDDVRGIEPDEGAWLTAEREFEREAELLSGLCHDNIIQFYGICDDGQPKMLVLEYMVNGDLNNYLRSVSSV